MRLYMGFISGEGGRVAYEYFDHRQISFVYRGWGSYNWGSGL